MRARVDATKILRLMEALGTASRGPGRVYLTGGATAVLLNWRPTTIDVDLKLDPEPPGAFDAIARLKDELDVNVELAAPDQFIPAIPGWHVRSLFIAKHGQVEFFHYDFLGQALSKIERGHTQDRLDVRAMLERSLVQPDALRAAFEQIEPFLKRFPAIDPDSFRAKLHEALDE